MEQRVTLITLGVRDLDRSTAFFERLGWKRSVRQAHGISFFQCGSIALGLFPYDELVRDCGLDAGVEEMAATAQRGISIAHNGRNREDVDRIMAEAEAAGATIVKTPRNLDWGGYGGYFTDIDGHLWEVAWNPGFPLDNEGAVSLPD